jgi:hypothetical protein
MYRRFLNLLCISASIPACAASDIPRLPDAWAGSHYGSCYSSIENGMADVYGKNYNSDENVVRKDKTYGSTRMILSADITSGTNAPRTIFEKHTDGKWCVVLTSPPVASITPKSDKKNSSRPLKWVTITQASPDFRETKIIYIWDKHWAIYIPAHCYHNYGFETKEFDCSNAYK